MHRWQKAWINWHIGEKVPRLGRRSKQQLFAAALCELRFSAGSDQLHVARAFFVNSSMRGLSAVAMVGEPFSGLRAAPKNALGFLHAR